LSYKHDTLSKYSIQLSPETLYKLYVKSEEQERKTML